MSEFDAERLELLQLVDDSTIHLSVIDCEGHWLVLDVIAEPDQTVMLNNLVAAGQVEVTAECTRPGWRAGLTSAGIVLAESLLQVVP